MTAVHQLVDQVLDQAQAAHPGVEFGITPSLANSLLLPKEGDKLWRPNAEGRVGYYSGHVYRDCLVDATPSEEPAPIDFLVIVSPVYGASAAAEEAVTYYGDLRTGAIGTSLPEDVQTHTRRRHRDRGGEPRHHPRTHRLNHQQLEGTRTTPLPGLDHDLLSL